MLCREFPEKYDWWLDLENKHKDRGDYGFFNKARKLSNLKDNVDNQQDWVFEQEGYFCQKNLGECTG